MDLLAPFNFGRNAYLAPIISRYDAPIEATCCSTLRNGPEKIPFAIRGLLDSHLGGKAEPHHQAGNVNVDDERVEIALDASD